MDTFIVTSAVDYGNGTATIGKCTIDDKTSLKQAELQGKGIYNMASRMEKSMPQMYAAVGIAIMDSVEGTEEEKAEKAIEVFNASQTVWNNAVRNGENVIELFEKRSGYEVESITGEKA